MADCQIESPSAWHSAASHQLFSKADELTKEALNNPERSIGRDRLGKIAADRPLLQQI